MEQVIVTHIDNTTLKLQSRQNRSTVTKLEQNVGLLGVDTIDITVESATKLNFYIGDKITVIGRDYTLNSPPRERKGSEVEFTYDLQFEGVQYDLIRASYSVNVDTTTNEIQDLNGDALTGDIEMFLNVLISNANRVFPNKWVLGLFPENTETKTLTFGESDNCLSVLQNLCSEDNYNTEFNISIDASTGVRTLNVGTIGSVFPFTFEYGRGKGIYELIREKQSSSNIITRLNVFGSTKNIMTTKYRSNRLCLPTKNKSQSYIEDATALANYGVWESTKIFEEVFPHRTGTITSLGDSELEFVDSSMDFDLNEKDVDGKTLYLVPGTAAKIHINKGNLAGYEFEITSYDHSTKKFKIKSFTDENGYTFPSETSDAFKFSEGDEYVLIDIYLPQSYIDAAETELQTKGSDYLNKYKDPNVQYALTEIDPFFLSRIVGAEVETNIIWPGDYLPVNDSDLGINKSLRVKSFTRDLLLDYKYKITVSDIPVAVSNMARIINEVKQIDNVVTINNLKDPARARRNYKATAELVNMIEVVQAEALLVGNDPAAQYELSGVSIIANHNSDPNAISISAGSINHNYYPVDSPGSWIISAGEFTDLAPSTSFYVYIKASKTLTTAIYYISSSKIGVDDVAGYYHFPLGILSSVIIGARVFTTTKGYTLITGDSIKTGKFVNQNGETVLDIDNRTFFGSFTFMSGSTGYENISDKPDLSVYALGSYVDTVAAGLQDQIDGVIDSWFYAYTPTTGNYPANEWTSDTLKQRHIGDTFTNTEDYVDDLTTPNAGKSWRWVNNSGVYSWTPIADSDAVKALQAAAAAQDTADGKRRVFTTQPANSDAYDVGDLWVNATYSTTYTNELLKCKTAKAAGAAFSIAHWEKASKYTDDTVATAAATAAANAQTSANTANTLLADIAADNKLTPVEKSSVRAEWDTIAAEKSVNDAQADTFGITTEKSTYGTKFQALATYLNNGITWSSGIPSWIADANLGTTTDIVGATFRLKFKEYYDARTALLNAVAAKAKTLADAAQTTANAAQTAATNAATAASNAQTSANAANTLLSDIASDSKLTPSEKQSTKQEWDIIVSEKTKIDAQADVYGVSKTAYATAYNALSTYITPLLASLTTTSDIVGTTFRSNFKTYYDARQDILNAISTAAKTLADAAQETIDNLQIGGRNYLRNSGFFKNLDYWGSYASIASVNLDGGYIKIVASSSGTPRAVNRTLIPLDTVVQKFIITVSYISDIDITTLGGKSSTSLTEYNESGAQSAGTFTFLKSEIDCGIKKAYFSWSTLIKSTALSSYIFIYLPKNSTANIVSVKVEKGDKPTAWSPSPDDVDAYIIAAQTSANTANTAIANISSDNVLSASEKSGERSRWNDIAAEKSGINAQANAYGITTENAAYNTAFQNLANYLNNGATWSSGIPSWLADANLGTNTTIVGSTYRSIWNAYFTARQTLMNAISAKAKTLADAAQTTASAAQADATLAVARTNGRTLIDGGIVETDVVLLGEDGNAGMSGIPVDNDNNPLPSRWAGGSYAQAIAGLATIVEWYNGDVKYGDLWIDSGGSVCIKDANGVTRVLLTRNVITTLAALAGSIQNDTVSNVANSNISEGTTSVQLANSIVVNNNNSQVTVVCTLSTSISSDLPDEASGRSVVTLTLLNTVTLEEISLGYVSAIYRGSTITNQVEVTKQLTVAAGTYKLKITYAHTNTANCEFSSGVSASTTTIVFDSAVQRTELGKNGLGIIGNATNYLIMAIESGTFKVVEKTTGVYDRPGVLAAASVASAGSSSNQWGAKVGSSLKSSTGTYTINHSVGHSNYSVQVTPLAASRVGYVSAKNNTSVTIVITNLSGTATDTAFDYNIIGNNQ